MSEVNNKIFLGSDTKSRQVGGTVPAPCRSLSYDGLSVELRASSTEEHTIAQRAKERDRGSHTRSPANTKGGVAKTASNNNGGSRKTGLRSSEDDLAINIARKYTERPDMSSEGEEDGRGAVNEEGMTTRSGTIKAPGKGKGKQPLTKEKDASGRKDGARRSSSLDGRKRRARVIDTSSDSEGGSLSRSRPRSKRNTDRDSEEGEKDAGESETEFEEADEIIIVDEERPPCMEKGEMGQVKRVMAEAEATVERLGVREDCPSLSSSTSKEGGRGRPATTGGYYLKQLQKAHKELVEKAQEIKILRDATIPAALSHGRKMEEKLAMQELRYAPAEILPATILEALNGVDLVLEKATLKGEHRGRLNKSAGTIKAALTLLVERYEHPATGRERDAEMELLREKIAAQEEDLVALHQAKAQNLQMQRELLELQVTVAVLKAQQAERNVEMRVTRAMEKGGKKRKLLPLIPSSSSEGEDQVVGEEEHAGRNEEMDTEPAIEEEEMAKNSRDKVMAEVHREGMPAVIRPPLQGKSAILDPAIPPAEPSAGPSPCMEQGYEPGLEQRLASMLVNCMNEKIGKMEERLRKDLAPLTQGKQEEKGKDHGTPPPVRKETSTAKVERKAGGKEKGGKKKSTLQPRTKSSDPTSTRGKTPWSQVLGQRANAASTSSPAPAPVKKAGDTRPRTRSQAYEATQVAIARLSKQEIWTQVKTRGRKGRGGPTQARPQARSQSRIPTERNTGKKEAAKKTGQGGKLEGGKKNNTQPRSTPPQKGKKRRVPRTAAVTLTCPEGEYAECMGEVRRKIQLESLGIDKVPNIRRTATGAISLEIAGQGNIEKADALAEKMAETLAGREGVKVGRPTMTADIRLVGFEDSMSGEEIGEALARKGNTGLINFKVGPIKKMANGLCSTVVSCPLAVANNIVREGKIALGWSSTKVELLDKRPLQCYKCMELGHTRATCRSERDRTGACYRCGEFGHPARECQAPVQCTVCKDKGLPHDHRIGGPACKGCKAGKRGKTERKKGEEIESGEAVKKGGEPANKKGKEKPRAVSNLKVKGFKVTEGGRLIAGVAATQDPPKENRLQKRKAEGVQTLVKSDALRIVGVVVHDEPPKEQRPPKRKKEVDKALDKPTDTTVPMDIEKETEISPSDLPKEKDKEGTNGGEIGIPATEPEWREEWGVTEEELSRALKRVKRGKAPGPDGIPGRAWPLAAGEMAGRMRKVFTACLKTGRFPRKWKEASLVLLPKEGKPPNMPSSYRPVCLLDEAGKILERIIAERLVQHLSQKDRRGLSDDQFGFRAGRSTVDAIKRVLARTEAEIAGGGVVMGIGFDVKNAFNSLPWPVIMGALLDFGVPMYLIMVVRDYFVDRGLTYTDRDGVLRVRFMECGVPQGSVLGPLLWIIAYDLVLGTPLLTGCWLSGYADDVYLGVRGEGWQELYRLANVAAASVVRSIERLGLKVAPQKTQATVFYNKRERGPPPMGLSLRVGGVKIPTTPQMKYLGMWLDTNRDFGAHVDSVAPRARQAANNLSRLLPNLGGAGGRVRRLYTATVHSILMYAAPVWWAKAESSRALRAKLESTQRVIALRAARAYRTVAHKGATILAGIPPVHLLARSYAEMYERVHEIRGRMGTITPQMRVALGSQAMATLVVRWKEWVADPRHKFGRRVAMAVQPVFEEWVEGVKTRGLTFHAVQILSGHGCFGEYLHRIGKERTTRCWYCPEGADTAQHTLEICPEWTEERRALRAQVGEDLSLPAIVAKMVRPGEEGVENWRAFASFTSAVLRRKEADERVRRREAAPPHSDNE